MLGLIRLFKELKRLKVQRKRYCIKREIHFGVDTDDYVFCLIPTIVFSPWTRRYNGEAIIDIHWLHLHICIGRWARKRR